MLYTNYTNYPTADKSFDFYSLYSIQLSACSLSIVALECFKLFFKLFCIFVFISYIVLVPACMHVQMHVPGPFVCSRKAVWWLPLIQKWKQYINMHPFALLYIVQQEVFPREQKNSLLVIRVVRLKLFLCYFLLLVLCFFLAVSFICCVGHTLSFYRKEASWTVAMILMIANSDMDQRIY